MKPLVTALLFTAAAAIALLGAIWLGQDKLLYFPAPATVESLASGGLRAWPSAQAFRGLVAEPAASARGTVVVFHGNAGHAGHRSGYAESLAPLGWRVLLAEYPGYGPRAGRPGEASLVADAEETLVAAHRDFGGPLLVLGESLGSGPASAAVARQPELVAGLLLITPWDRLAHVASHHYPWLPVEWMLRDRYETLATLRRFERPVVVVVAEHDRVVPARFGRALQAGLGERSRLLVVAGSGHNDWIDRVDAGWWAEAIALALGPPGPPAPPR